MAIFPSLHKGKAPYVAYTALFSYICLAICRLLYVTLPTPDSLIDWLIPLELIIFLLPAAVYLFFKQEKPSTAQLYLTPPKAHHIPLTVTAVLALTLGGLLMTIVLCGSGLSPNRFILYDTFSTHKSHLAYIVIAHALLPAVCEELLFRSLLCGEYQRHGALIATLVTALLFGMLHFNIQMLPLFVVSGIVLSLVTYATRSVAVAMIVHFIYNLFCIFVQPYLIAFYINTVSPGLFIMLCAVLFLASAALFCLFASRIYAQLHMQGAKPQSADQATQNPITELKQAVISLPLILCVVIFVAVVIIF